MTELVLIGIDMNHREVESSLDKCLLIDEEMQSNWNGLYDHLPAFVQA